MKLINFHWEIQIFVTFHYANRSIFNNFKSMNKDIYFERKLNVGSTSLWYWLINQDCLSWCFNFCSVIDQVVCVEWVEVVLVFNFDSVHISRFNVIKLHTYGQIFWLHEMKLINFSLKRKITYLWNSVPIHTCNADDNSHKLFVID